MWTWFFDEDMLQLFDLARIPAIGRFRPIGSGSRAEVPAAGIAGVAELADAPDLGSGGENRGGSSPSARTRLGPMA